MKLSHNITIIKIRKRGKFQNVMMSAKNFMAESVFSGNFSKIADFLLTSAKN